MADAAHKAAEQARGLADLNLSDVKRHDEEYSYAHAAMAGIESDCAVLFEALLQFSCPQKAPWQVKRLDLQRQCRRQRDEHSGEGTRGWNFPSSYPARRASLFAAVPGFAR